MWCSKNKLSIFFVMILLSSSKTSFGGIKYFRILFSNESSAEIAGLSVIAEFKGNQKKAELDYPLETHSTCNMNIPIEIENAEREDKLLIKKISFKYKDWGTLEHCFTKKNDRNYFIFKEVGDEISHNFAGCCLILSPLLVQSRFTEG